MPKHLWMLDGRLLWWYYTASTGEVSTFMVGHEHVTVEAGLSVLSDHAHGRDGKLLGPVRLLPMGGRQSAKPARVVEGAGDSAA